MLQDIAIPFISIALAELGDKSQLLIFLLAARTKRHLQLLIGAILGFIIVDGFAIVIGSWVVNIIPAFWIKIMTGIIFIILGVLMLMAKKEESEKKTEVKNPFLASFLMILMAEWGDKTQIASALFATKYNSFSVFLGVIGALTILSTSAIYVGKFIAHKIKPTVTTKVAGTIFIVVGIISLLYN